MSTQNVIKAMKIRQEELDILISRLENSIAKREQGTLVRSTVRGTVRFYLRKTNNPKRIYLNKERINIVKDLAQKQFEEKILSFAKEESIILQRYSQTLSEFNNCHDSRMEYEKLPGEIKELVNPSLEYEDDYVLQWQKARFNRARTTEFHIFDTLAKEKVRSKSEALIADRLYSAGIPYRYEQQLVFDSDVPGPEEMHSYYPDFTILNKKTRKIIYWEHLGKLGDPAYCRDNLPKLHDYMKHGIIQGKNLILTFESADRPLLTKDVDLLIKQFLL